MRERLDAWPERKPLTEERRLLCQQESKPESIRVAGAPRAIARIVR